MSLNLDLSSFQSAIAQLENSLEYYYSEKVQEDPGLVLQLRAAAIQAFEFTYELSWKMLKRYLELTEPNPEEIDKMSFFDLIRTGSERALLLSEVKIWKGFRKERGTTSHTYDQKKAIVVFEQIPRFLEEAKYLFDKLHERTR
jgi:nucleotidyltransferase substrate binding protein (TIGR01987 family)